MERPKTLSHKPNCRQQSLKRTKKMRREGRQHGMVRYLEKWPLLFQNKRSRSIAVNQFDNPPTTGSSTRVPSRPTNHSKYTGKCGRPRCQSCHMHPVCKSKGKTKGAHKLNSRDVVLNYRLSTWRAGDQGGQLNFTGISASAILDRLRNDFLDHELEDEGESCRVEEEEEEGMDSGETVETGDGRFCELGLVWDQVDSDEDWCMVDGV